MALLAIALSVSAKDKYDFGVRQISTISGKQRDEFAKIKLDRKKALLRVDSEDFGERTIPFADLISASTESGGKDGKDVYFRLRFRTARGDEDQMLFKLKDRRDIPRDMNYFRDITGMRVEQGVGGPAR